MQQTACQSSSSPEVPKIYHQLFKENQDPILCTAMEQIPFEGDQCRAPDDLGEQYRGLVMRLSGTTILSERALPFCTLQAST